MSAAPAFKADVGDMSAMNASIYIYIYIRIYIYNIYNMYIYIYIHIWAPVRGWVWGGSLRRDTWCIEKIWRKDADAEEYSHTLDRQEG